MSIEVEVETFGPDRITCKDYEGSLPATLERRLADGWEYEIHYSMVLGTRGPTHSALVVFYAGYSFRVEPRSRQDEKSK